MALRTVRSQRIAAGTPVAGDIASASTVRWVSAEVREPALVEACRRCRPGSLLPLSTEDALELIELDLLEAVRGAQGQEICPACLPDDVLMESLQAVIEDADADKGW